MSTSIEDPVADPRDRVRQRARARVLEGAARAFAATGYHGTSVPAIAAAAGVSVGLIYRYFPSKAELFLTICTAEGAERIAVQLARLAAIADPRARLRAAVGQFVDDLVGETRAGVQISAYGEAEHNPKVRELLRGQSERIAAATDLLLRDAIRRGDAPSDLPVRPLARAIAMLFDGAVLARVAAGDTFSGEDVGEAMTALIGAALGWA